MKRLLKEKKAITLIALVITIVVLVILAAVTISLTVGNEGLIARAKKAAQDYANSQDKDKQDINDLYGQLVVATDGTVTIDASTLSTMIQQEVARQLTSSQTTNLNYSTEEQEVGTWIDGITPIYQKLVNIDTITTSNLSAGNTFVVTGLESQLKASVITYAAVIRNDGTFTPTVAYVNENNINLIPAAGSMNYSSSKTRYLSIQYTKIKD